MNEKTVVLGASPKPYRYSYMAAQELEANNLQVILIGRRAGEVNGKPILTKWPQGEEVDTITMYLSAANQVEYYDEILSSGAKRIIFNPGAENNELAQRAKNQGIEVENACTLVLLATGQY